MHTVIPESVLLIVGVCQRISHLHIFTSHLLIFSSAHLHIFTFSLAPLLSCPLAFSFLSISLLKARDSANETARNAILSRETKFDRQKLQ